jgi:hypothetical protein
MSERLVDPENVVTYLQDKFEQIFIALVISTIELFFCDMPTGIKTI